MGKYTSAITARDRRLGLNGVTKGSPVSFQHVLKTNGKSILVRACDGGPALPGDSNTFHTKCIKCISIFGKDTSFWPS